VGQDRSKWLRSVNNKEDCTGAHFCEDSHLHHSSTIQSRTLGVSFFFGGGDEKKPKKPKKNLTSQFQDPVACNADGEMI
jgi:hypothetical protein